MADLLVVVIVVAAAIGAVVVVRRQMDGETIIRRQLAQAEVTTVATAVPGTVVRLTGVIRAVGEAPLSEMSERPFVARDLRITTRDGDGGHPTRPARQSFDFLLDDGTGVALIRASGAAVSLPRDVETPTTTLDRVMWLDPILRASGYHNGSPQTCRVTVSEGLVGPGDRVSAVGLVSADDAMAADLGARISLSSGDHPIAIVAPDT